MTMFSFVQGKIIDPFFTLRFKRSEQSAQGLTSFEPHLHSYMIKILTERGITDEEIKGRSQLWLVDAATDFFLPYALFAMLISPDLGGIIPTETVLFSPKEMKTARKFGKSWITGALKSHLMIRIGHHAAAHMQERVARLEFERQAQDDRNSPIRHWVSEHGRHYRSGKIVLVKAHHRGQEPKPNLPTRVMGPRSQAVEFELPPKD